MSRGIILIQAFLTAFTLHLLLFSYSSIIPLIVKEMEITYAEAGFIFSICILAVIVLRIPWGFIIDRIGFMAAVKIAMTLIGVFSLLRGFSQSYYTLLFSQLLLGAGFAAILPCLAKLVNVMFQEKVGFATGVYVAGFPTGELVGLGLTSYLLLALNGDWRTIFKIFGVWSLILAVLWWLIDRRIPLKQTHLNNQSKWRFKNLIRLKQLWILTGLCICSMGCYDTILTWLPSMLEIREIPVIEASITTSIFPLGFLLSGPVIGTLSDKIGLRKPFIWILGATSIVFIVFISYSTQTSLWISILVVGFALSGILTLTLIIPTEHPEFSELVGGAVGLISSIGNIGSFLFPITVGFLIDTTGSSIPPLVLLAIISGITIILNIAVRETGKNKRLHSLI
ncbi:MFS transporter [Candidatus Bathyarchaeota archaeon]|nr:MFS transporter [Candidatus Bathyarchaeota archaeon]